VTADDVWDQLTDLVRETFDHPDLAVIPETTAKDVEGWDSLTHIQFMVAVERAFGIRFATGELSGLKNVGELARLIARRLGLPSEN
jgi:acyl carrier protein